MNGKRTGCAIRALNESDSSEVGFLYKSWLGSYKNYASEIPYSMYRKLYQCLLERILNRPGSSVLMACDPENHDVIWGFIVFEREHPVVHYMYTKDDFRRQGVGMDLLDFCAGTPPVEFDFTFNTRMGRNFLRKRGGRYNPKFVRNELP